jgi:hypothetical protein
MKDAMAYTLVSMLSAIGRRARIVAATLIAGLWPGRDAPEIACRISSLPRGQQAAVVGGVLGFLFLLSLFAAQFGLLGMAVFFMTVIVVVA